MPKFQKVPKVADGARGPSAAAKVQFDEIEQPAEDRPIVAEGDILFESTRAEEAPGQTAWGWHGYANLQVQLTGFGDVYDATTGRVSIARNRVAKFDNGYFLLKKAGNKHFAEDRETLLNHAGFGVGKLFWLADDQRKVDETKEMNRALKFLTRQSEVSKQLRERLGLSDDLTELKLPERTQPSPAA